MRYWLCCILMLSTTASAGTFTSHFFSQGKRHSLTIAKESVVVTSSERLVATAWPLLANYGLAVVDRTAAASDQIVGYPLRFGSSTSEAVLTHEIVVKFANTSGLQAMVAHPDFRSFQETPFQRGLVLAKYASPLSALNAANELYSHEGVVYAHPNFLIPKDVRAKLTQEPLFFHQWHLHNTGQSGGQEGADISAEEAWAITEGDPSTLVAVVDTGFFPDHPDLMAAWYRFPDEIADNGRDDDGNGFVDDTIGWNFYRDNNDPSDSDIIDHGTAVAGVVGARKNGLGVTGICPRCTLLPIVMSTSVVKDAAALNYAWQNGAHVITNSWGYPVGTPETDVVVDAIEQAATLGRSGKGAIVVFAMSNIDTNDCDGSYPDISSLEKVIGVSSSSDLDIKVNTSGWGPCMELVAPSKEKRRTGIVTTDLLGGRGYNNGAFDDELEDRDYTNSFSGTSAATPSVAAVAALIVSAYPDLTREEVVLAVTAGADKINPGAARYDPISGFSRTYGFGRLNAHGALLAAERLAK